MTLHLRTDYKATATVAPYTVPAYEVGHPAETEYFASFESVSTEGFFAGKANVVCKTGNGALRVATDTNTLTSTQVIRAVDGLTVGMEYTLTARAFLPSSSSITHIFLYLFTAEWGWLNLTDSVTIYSGPQDQWLDLEIPFLCTTPSMNVSFEAISAPAGVDVPLTPVDDFYIDDFRLVREPWLETVPAAPRDTVDLPILDGKITLDDGWSPYVQAQLEVPAVDPAILELLDPLDDVRVKIETSRYDLGDGMLSQLQSTRTFDLALRDREVTHEDGTLSLTLESDEALLQDWRRNETTSDTSATADQSSIRNIINNVVLSKIGATLQPGSLNSRFDILEDSTNLILNPNGALNANEWASGGGCTVAWLATAGLDNQPGMIQATATAATGAVWANSNVNYIAATEGTSYTGYLTAQGASSPTGSITIRYLNAAKVALANHVSSTAVLVSAGWRVFNVTAPPAPAGTAFVGLFFGFTGSASGRVIRIDRALLVENKSTAGINYGVFFDGNTPDSPDYSYKWTGTAHASTSTRTALVDRSPDLLSWQAGETAYDFVEPLLNTLGFRLWCDEQRRWWLTDNSYTAPGRMTVSENMNALSGTDTISVNKAADDRDIPAGATGIVCKYNWTNAQGNPQAAVDVAGTPERAHLIEFKRAYPGPGAAAHMLSRSAGRGRVQDVAVLADFSANPGQEISISLPDTEDQSGLLSAVTWRLSEDSMELKSRGLVDTDPNSWYFTPDSKTWANTVDAVTWANFTN